MRKDLVIDARRGTGEKVVFVAPGHERALRGHLPIRGHLPKTSHARK